MDTKKQPSGEEKKLKALELSLNELLGLYDELRRENVDLRQRFEVIAKDHVVLREKNDLSRKKMEAMIGRLKSLEYDL